MMRFFLRVDREKWQRLGVHGATASQASRSGVNAKTLRAPAAGSMPSVWSCLLPLTSAHIAGRTHPARIAVPHLSDEYTGEIDQHLVGPGRFESHRISDKCFPHKSFSSLPFYLSVAAPSPPQPMPWVIQPQLPPPGGLSLIHLHGRSLSQCLVRPQLVVGSDPPIGSPLLRPTMHRGRQ